MFGKDKHSSLFVLRVGDFERKSFMTLTPERRPQPWLLWRLYEDCCVGCKSTKIHFILFCSIWLFYPS